MRLVQIGLFRMNELGSRCMMDGDCRRKKSRTTKVAG